MAVCLYTRRPVVRVCAGLDHHGHTGVPSHTHGVIHTPSRVPQLELSQYAKTGSLCLGGGMIALLVAERMLRDFATSTVFESGAGACLQSHPLLRDVVTIIPGLFTLLVRSLIGAVFLTKMKETISNCATPSREPFLRAFAIAGACFFFTLPLLALLLFLFANNCSLARNVTLIAGLSQVCWRCCVSPVRGLGFRCLHPHPSVFCSCWVCAAWASSSGPRLRTRMLS